MKNEHLDRRTKKTRKLLLDGLVKLMLEHDINEITVKDLTEAIDINRSTFYIHYKDIYDLLNSIEAELLEEFDELLSCNMDTAEDVHTQILPVLKALYHRLYEHKELVSAFLGPHGDVSFINSLQELLSSKITGWWTNDSPDAGLSPFYSAFCFSGCIGIIKEWTKSGYRKQPDEMADITAKLLINGI